MTRKEVKVGGPTDMFLAMAIILLSIAAFVASWGILWRAWDWAF